MKYEIISYDVWGNKKDGFEVNDAHHTGLEIEIADGATDKEIVQALKRAGFLKRGLRYSSIEIDGEEGFSLYVTYEPDWYPLCELRPIEEEEEAVTSQEANNG